MNCEWREGSRLRLVTRTCENQEAARYIRRSTTVRDGAGRRLHASEPLIRLGSLTLAGHQLFVLEWMVVEHLLARNPAVPPQKCVRKAGGIEVDVVEVTDP